MNKTAKWTAAILLSLGVHAGAAIAMLPVREPMLVAGGASMEIAILGNSFETTVQSGTVTDTVDPLETPPDEVVPEQPETTQAAAVAPETPPDTVAEVAPDLVPSEADVILPTDQIPSVAADEPEFVASIPPVATVVPEERPEQPPEPEVVEKQPVAEPAPVKKAEPEKPRRKPQPQTAGEAGKMRDNTTKGRVDGAQAATSASDGDIGASTGAAGNAAVSNYPGKVRSKLNRAFRYPTEARRAGLKGTARVSFTVTASGAVSGVTIARSAGSPILDEAAIDAVHRAAPFPKIPQGAGKSNWAFTIPLAFTR